MSEQVMCFKCPRCESWHPEFTGVKQHMTRRHNDQQIESTEGLDYGLCSQTGARKTFIPVNSAEVHVALDNFRTQSLFAQRSLFGVTVPSVEPATMVSYFPPKIGSVLMTSIRKQVKEFLEWIELQSCQEWSLDLRNRMADHGFKPIQSTSHPKYSQTLTAFCFLKNLRGDYPIVLLKLCFDILLVFLKNFLL